MTVKCIYLEADSRERDYQNILLRAICSSHPLIHRGRMWGEVYIGSPPFNRKAEIVMEFKAVPIVDDKRKVKVHMNRKISLGSSSHIMANTEIDLRAPIKDIIDEISSYLLKCFYEINNEVYEEYKYFCNKWEDCIK